MQTIADFLERMNNTSFLYVVLRNFEGLPYDVVVGEHSDLDLLVYELDHWQELYPEAIREYKSPRVRHKVPIGDTYFYCDVRHVGDGYYPEEFENNILNTREWNANGFYTPNPIHFRIALAYHAVHHKGANSYQRHLGDATVDDLYQSLKKSNVGWSEPDDPTVGRFNPYFKGATSVVTKDKGKVTKTQTGFMKYNLIENEARILSQVESVHFPKVLKHNKDSIEIEDCGEQLTVENLPFKWKEQLIEIMLDLQKYNIEHRDIKPDNLMVKDSVIKLIDFGWGRFLDDPQDTPPSCLGLPYRPSWGWSDNFSMRKVIKELEYKKEGQLANIGN